MHTNGYLQTEGLQHGLEIVADYRWLVSLIGEKIIVVSRQLDIENNQNSCEQYRGFQRLEFERLSLLFLVEFVVFGGVVAAAIVIFIGMGTAMMADALAGRRFGMLAAFRFRKQTHVLQLFLTKVFAQGEAGRAEQHRQSEDDM